MHYSIKRQRGIGLWGLIILVPMLGFYIYLGIKLGPEYFRDMTIGSIVNGVATEHYITEPTRLQLREKIQKRLLVNEIRYIKRDQLKFPELKDGIHIQVNYEREIPIVANVSARLNFEHDVRVRQQ